MTKRSWSALSLKRAAKAFFPLSFPLFALFARLCSALELGPSALQKRPARAWGWPAGPRQSRSPVRPKKREAFLKKAQTEKENTKLRADRKTKKHRQKKRRRKETKKKKQAKDRKDEESLFDGTPRRLGLRVALGPRPAGPRPGPRPGPGRGARSLGVLRDVSEARATLLPPHCVLQCISGCCKGHWAVALHTPSDGFKALANLGFQLATL